MSSDDLRRAVTRIAHEIVERNHGLSEVVLVALQLVPYGRRHMNPPARVEPRWDAPATRALAVRACYDCHSNQATWRWYTSVAPFSWLIQHDVDEGRQRVNYSEWGTRRMEADNSARQVQRGEMPPWYYLPLHPEAKLTDQEAQELVQGMTATFGSGRERSSGGGRRGTPTSGG